MTDVAPSMSVLEIDAALTAPGSRFEMETCEVQGRLVRAWKNAPADLRTILERSKRRSSDVFLVYEDEHLTFEEHFQQVTTMAHHLADDVGVEKGDRVAIAMRNYPEWSVAFFATVALGAIVVPLNAWWTAAELAYGLEDSGARVLFVDHERLERLGGLDGALDELALTDSTIVARPVGSTRGRTFEEILRSRHDELPPVDLAPDDPATIFYTSGTTGHPKGALGTHRNICTNLLSLSFSAARTAMATTDDGTGATEAKGTAKTARATGAATVYLLSVPLFHATGCHSILVPMLASGGKIVMMRKWDAERALELIERERVTTFGGVPTMVWQVLSSPSLATRDISSVKTVGYGGAPAPPELVSRISELFPGRTPSNGYGLTETSSVTTVNAGIYYQQRPDSVGVPVPVVDVKIVDDVGEDCPVGSVGELLVYGPNVVMGYWGRPEDTAMTFVDGWLRTGDLARVDEDGFVYVVDRAKDMIIRGGENVYCAEVEAAFFENPDVGDVATFGVPHPELGEEVGAVVLLRAGSATDSAELRAYASERLAAFKVPTHIWFTESELPRSPAGKVLKKVLRARYLESDPPN
jgi:acyl-CoA synthetase (AMP-forming)/AMP-acid ligase II